MQRNGRLRALVIPVASLLAISVLGCGGGSEVPQAKVHGEVTFDGQPVAKGTITFFPADGKGPVAGGDIENGKYSISVPPGAKTIQISSPKVVGQRKAYDTPDSPMIDVTEELIPAAYNVQSKLSETVEMPETQLDFALKADGS